MNQVEGFFSILARRSIRRADFPSKAALVRHIEAFLLIATPVVRVAVSFLLFLAERDWLYARLTMMVLLLLLASFMLGKVE